jgi:predicted AlkP superfamily phosphohydrolase/phosphomutase
LKRAFRTIIIGLDGVPFSLIKELSEKQVMSSTRNLIKKGVFKQMDSSIPEVSSVAWSSIITGKNPGEHGIFGFTDISERTYQLSFPNFYHLKVPPFWEKRVGQRSIIINIPGTFPVRPLNGVHISGFVSLDLERSVYPPSLISKLTKLNYQVDVDSSKAHKSMDLFLNDLDKTLKARIDAYRLLWKEPDWQNFVLVFTGTDRLSHFLWEAYENENHLYHSYFLDYFQRLDKIIGEIAERIFEHDQLILLSDHGFELLEKEIHLNFFLKELGFLKIKPETKGDLTEIEFGTKAFALDPGRIYINLKDRYPKGSVKKRDYHKVREELIKAFSEWELEGKKVVKKVFKKEEIYQGPFLNQAPDLVLISNKGFDFKAKIKIKELWTKGIFTGKHTQDNAFLLTQRRVDEDIIGPKPSVFDICKIIEAKNSN